MKDLNVEDSSCYIGAVRPNRKPRDSSKVAHDGMNSIFIKAVGLPLRSASLFCTKNKGVAESYDRPFVIFPIGEVYFAWSPYISDPYEVYIDQSISSTLSAQFKRLMPEITKKFPNITSVESLLDNDRAINYALSLIPDAWVYDHDISKCPSHNEIMVACDRYYAVAADEARKLGL